MFARKALLAIIALMTLSSPLLAQNYHFNRSPTDDDSLNGSSTTYAEIEGEFGWIFDPMLLFGPNQLAISEVESPGGIVEAHAIAINSSSISANNQSTLKSTNHSFVFGWATGFFNSFADAGASASASTSASIQADEDAPQNLFLVVSFDASILNEFFWDVGYTVRYNGGVVLSVEGSNGHLEMTSPYSIPKVIDTNDAITATYSATVPVVVGGTVTINGSNSASGYTPNGAAGNFQEDITSSVTLSLIPDPNAPPPGDENGGDDDGGNSNEVLGGGGPGGGG